MRERHWQAHSTHLGNEIRDGGIIPIRPFAEEQCALVREHPERGEARESEKGEDEKELFVCDVNGKNCNAKEREKGTVLVSF